MILRRIAKFPWEKTYKNIIKSQIFIKLLIFEKFISRKKINQEKNNSFIKSPAKSPCSAKKLTGIYRVDRSNITKETILLDGSFQKADSCISLVMRPVMFGFNLDSIEEMQIGNLVSSKKSMSIHTGHQKSMNDNESLSIWQKTNTANTNTLCKKEVILYNHEKVDI